MEVDYQINSEGTDTSRVLFYSDTNRKYFFSQLRLKFGTWQALMKNIGTYKSRLERFRSGQISLPYSTFVRLLNYLGKDDAVLIKQNVYFRQTNWGRSKGGITTYSKHREIFEEGRKIAARRAGPKYKFNFDMLLTEQIAEFIGAFIGDGFTNYYGNSYIVQITGDSRLDRAYYSDTLIPYIKTMCPESNPIINSYNNTLRLTINSKEFHELLTQRFGFERGKKAHTVKMPREILGSNNWRIINHCIRGIFDTDGYVFFDRRKAYEIPYLRIGLQMVSKDLIQQINQLLLQQGIRSKITSKGDRIQINGLDECRKIVNTVGFSNSRHLNKLKGLFL
ncbi:MAG: LAGLIDADG family homing endonuclease [Candidatus Woesearchaeota archaeon]